MKAIRGKHRQGLNKIVKRLKESGWINIVIEDEFSMAKICQKTGRPVEGECDVHAEKYLCTGKHYLGVFEYKSNNKPKHADKGTIQLCKDFIQYKHNIRPHPDSVVSFFVFGDKPTYKRVHKRVLESVVWNYKF